MPHLDASQPRLTHNRGPTFSTLVVERDRLVRELISIQLHLQGHVVLEANTGEQALALLRGGQAVNVLLTEIETSAGPDGWGAGAVRSGEREQSRVLLTAFEKPLTAR